MAIKKLTPEAHKWITNRVLYLVLAVVVLKLFTTLIDMQFVPVDWLTYAVANSICDTQLAYGVDCVVNGNVVSYSTFHAVISFACLGLEHIIFFIIVGLIFSGIENKKAVKRVIIMAIYLLFLNLARLFGYYALVQRAGFTSAVHIHDFVFNYGHAIILLIFLVIHAAITIKEAKLMARESHKPKHKARKHKKK